MTLTHRALAVLASLCWGLNVIAIHISLEHFPPLFLAGARFLLLALPAVIFVPWPGVRLRHLLGFGLGTGTVQFVGLYLGMAAGLPAGVASLVLTCAAPLTLVLGVILLREPTSGSAAAGAGLALGGLALAGWARGGGGGEWAPFLLVLLGAVGWAAGTLASRRAQAEDPLALVLWMAVVPPVPLLGLSLVVEGPEEIRDALAASISWQAAPAWAGLTYTVLVGSLLAPVVWVWLLRRHPAGTVAPYSMLVPVVGLVAAWALLGERPAGLELVGAVLVVVGVLVGGRRRPRTE
ncbi:MULTISPECIES: EamA family transporter [Actinomycetes]|uniref:EamA family transporter n=2 Tax=Actinomycetes TaxID=1760 RepID=A0ABP6M2R5_9MICC